jgi:hypothetical protein
MRVAAFNSIFLFTSGHFLPFPWVAMPKAAPSPYANP